MSKEQLRVLIVEDREEDAILMKRSLEKADFEIDFKLVGTKEGLSDALRNEEWDLILSDYNLPQMNGLDALRIRMEKQPLTPFIVVTGTIGEEAAIELMKAGADDYIIKSNIIRLASAVRQTIKTAAIRKGKHQAQVKLKKTKIMLEGITNGIDDRLFLLSPKFRILWANRAVLHSLRCGLEDIRGRTCHEVLFHRDSPCLPPDAHCLLHAGPNGSTATSIYTLNGLTLEVKAYPVRFGEHREPCFIHVSRDITKLQESRAESVRNLNKLQKLLRDTIEALSGTMELRDLYTTGHQKKVSRLATAIARDLGVDQRNIDGIYLAAIIHDLGKIAVPSEILAKPSQLDAIEMGIIKLHSQTGFDILKKIDFPWPVARTVHEHHERLNGSGYPQGLKEEEICLEAKILAVADVVEAMASRRPYRPGLGIDVALAEIEKNSGLLYDRRSAQACLRLFRENNFSLEDG